MLVAVDDGIPIFLTPRDVAKIKSAVFPDRSTSDILDEFLAGETRGEAARRAIASWLMQRKAAAPAEFEAQYRCFDLHVNQLHQEIDDLLNDWCAYAGMGRVVCSHEPIHVAGNKANQPDHTVTVEIAYDIDSQQHEYAVKFLVNDIETVQGTIDSFVVVTSGSSTLFTKFGFKVVTARVGGHDS